MDVFCFWADKQMSVCGCGRDPVWDIKGVFDASSRDVELSLKVLGSCLLKIPCFNSTIYSYPLFCFLLIAVKLDYYLHRLITRIAWLVVNYGSLITLPYYLFIHF